MITTRNTKLHKHTFKIKLVVEEHDITEKDVLDMLTDKDFIGINRNEYIDVERIIEHKKK